VSPPGTLYLVPTPIGDPDDFTRRALSTLEAVEVVAVEDTRSARALLQKVGISARLLSYHEHNEQSRAPQLVERLRRGADVALMPEAGTPLVSDPGYRLVRLAIAAGIAVRPLPGPSAVLAALAASGLPPDRFSFVGFLPRQREKRKAALADVRTRTETIVAFEAPHRVLASLDDAVEVLGDRRAAIAWNLSKPTERFLRGRLSEIRAELGSWDYVHGEMTLVVEGADAARARLAPDADEAISVLLAHGLTPRAVRDALAPLLDVPRRDLYERAVELARARQ
jgi:16S rRNA (cytidine1402-2'-O)-methyltransferase